MQYSTELINHITGAVSQTLFVLCALPQIIKTYRTKSIEGVSIHMWVIYLIAEAFAVAYFITCVTTPFWALAQTCISLVLVAYFLGLVLYYYKNPYRLN